MLHSYYVNGALVFYEDNKSRWVDAQGDRVVKYINDFVNQPVDDTTGDPTGWNIDVVENGAGNSTATVQNTQNGILKLEGAGNEDDGVNLQLKGESFKLTSSDPLYFGARIAVDEATQSDFIVGLCITDTTLLGGMTDGVYFRKVDGGTTAAFVTEKDSTETSTNAATVAASTYYWVEFFWDGSTYVKAYWNGSLVATHSTNIPSDEELTVSLAYLNGAAQSSKGLLVDKVSTIQCLAAR